MERKTFGERCDTKDNIYYLRLNQDDKMLFLCDQDEIKVEKNNLSYSVKIKGGGLYVEKDTKVSVIELLNNNKDQVGFRVLPFPLFMIPEDKLELSWNICAFYSGGGFCIND